MKIFLLRIEGYIKIKIKILNKARSEKKIGNLPDSANAPVAYFSHSRSYCSGLINFNDF